MAYKFKVLFLLECKPDVILSSFKLLLCMCTHGNIMEHASWARQCHKREHSPQSFLLKSYKSTWCHCEREVIHGCEVKVIHGCVVHFVTARLRISM